MKENDMCVWTTITMYNSQDKDVEFQSMAAPCTYRTVINEWAWLLQITCRDHACGGGRYTCMYSPLYCTTRHWKALQIWYMIIWSLCYLILPIFWPWEPCHMWIIRNVHPRLKNTSTDTSDIIHMSFTIIRLKVNLKSYLTQ